MLSRGAREQLLIVKGEIGGMEADGTDFLYLNPQNLCTAQGAQ